MHGKLSHAAGGSGVAIMAPLLDNQVEKLNMVEPGTGKKFEKRKPGLEEGKLLIFCVHVVSKRQDNEKVFICVYNLK